MMGVAMPTPAGAPTRTLTPSEQLHAAGLRVTPQRQLVLETLAGAGTRHLTADELWQEVSRRYSSFNRSTVYRVLDLLVATGVVAQHLLGDTVARYELSTATVHHHLVCHGCRAVFDLDPRALRGLIAAARTTHGFVVGAVGLTIEGMCAECAGSAQTAGHPRGPRPAPAARA